jgi:hypothetical protein
MCLNLNVPARSFMGVLLLFQEPSKPYACDPEKFYNPKITKVEIIIDGKSNQLYAKGMCPYQQFDEARKYFGGGPGKCHPEAGTLIKDLHLSNVSLGEYLTDKYALWLDLRTSDDRTLHGSGRRVEGTDGISLQIAKEDTGSGYLNMYIYLVQDAQLNIINGRFHSIEYV